mgnify:CR=1 FL=1
MVDHRPADVLAQGLSHLVATWPPLAILLVMFTAAALLTGVGLALAGVVVQQSVQNRMVEPSLIGTPEAAMPTPTPQKATPAAAVPALGGARGRSGGGGPPGYETPSAVFRNSTPVST